MTNITHFPGRPVMAPYVPPPCDCSDYSEPEDDLRAARGVYGWVAVMLAFWGVVIWACWP